MTAYLCIDNLYIFLEALTGGIRIIDGYFHEYNSLLVNKNRINIVKNGVDSYIHVEWIGLLDGIIYIDKCIMCYTLCNYLII